MKKFTYKLYYNNDNRKYVSIVFNITFSWKNPFQKMKLLPISFFFKKSSDFRILISSFILWATKKIEKRFQIIWIVSFIKFLKPIRYHDVLKKSFWYEFKSQNWRKFITFSICICLKFIEYYYYCWNYYSFPKTIRIKVWIHRKFRRNSYRKFFKNTFLPINIWNFLNQKITDECLFEVFFLLISI